jgi:hypothetical protein
MITISQARRLSGRLIEQEEGANVAGRRSLGEINLEPKVGVDGKLIMEADMNP